MMSRKLDRERWVLVFQTGEEVLSTLKEFAAREKLAGANFSAIGGFSRATLAFFDLAAKEYRPIPVGEQVEVVSLAGNIAEVGDDLKVHAHALVSRSDGSALGGHLLEGHVRPTLELFLTEAGELRREKDEETGLPLLDVQRELDEPMRDLRAEIPQQKTDPTLPPGDFDARAAGSSRQVWATRHRGWLAAGAAAVVALTALAARRR